MMEKSRSFRSRISGFTLVELLVVLFIIGLLASLLFPAVKRLQEGVYQTTCMTNLKQIGVAARLYYQDEKRHPATLALLLPASASIVIATGPRLTAMVGTPVVANGSHGYLSNLDAIKCPDDDTEWNVPTSSYEMSLTPVWNFYGYLAKGDSFSTRAAGRTIPPSLLVNPTLGYDAQTNPVKASLSNRYAPPNTVITHCLFHRTQTSDLDDPEAIYDPLSAPKAAGARDIILRLDGSARARNVADFGDRTKSQWQEQNF